MNSSQAAFFLRNELRPKRPYAQLHHVITDRGSKYSVTAVQVESKQELLSAIKTLKEDKAYRKATHNTYAARYIESGAVVEVKADDGETGAGMTILRPMRSANLVNCVIIVTRWFGGIKLQGDRFKHVQDATTAGIIAITS